MYKNREREKRKQFRKWEENKRELCGGNQQVESFKKQEIMNAVRRVMLAERSSKMTMKRVYRS